MMIKLNMIAFVFVLFSMMYCGPVVKDGAMGQNQKYAIETIVGNKVFSTQEGANKNIFGLLTVLFSKRSFKVKTGDITYASAPIFEKRFGNSKSFILVSNSSIKNSSPYTDVEKELGFWYRKMTLAKGYRRVTNSKKDKEIRKKIIEQNKIKGMIYVHFATSLNIPEVGNTGDVGIVMGKVYPQVQVIIRARDKNGKILWKDSFKKVGDIPVTIRATTVNPEEVRPLLPAVIDAAAKEAINRLDKHIEKEKT